MIKRGVCIGWLLSAYTLAIAQTTADSFRFPLDVAWQKTQDFNKWNGDWWGYHLGEDVVVSSELPVHAAGNGTIIHVGQHSGYGWVVIVQHALPAGDVYGPTVATLYAHMRHSGIATLGPINKGAVIGYLSSNSNENGGYSFTHIHFAIKQLPLQTGCTSQDDPSSNWWAYAGYSTLFALCNTKSSEINISPSDLLWPSYQPLHVSVVGRWIPPSDFVNARATSNPPTGPTLTETFNNAPDYSNNWTVAWQTGSPIVTYTPGNFRIQAPNECPGGWSPSNSGVSVGFQSKQSFVGNVDVSFQLNHGGYGRTSLGLWSVNQNQRVVEVDLDTDDTAYLNFSSGAFSTQYQYSSAPYMNKWITLRIQVVGNQVNFYADNGSGQQLLQTWPVPVSSPPDAYLLVFGSGSVCWKSGANDTSFRLVTATGQ